MLGIPIGLLYQNVGEWLIHKHLLHGLGKDKRSFWSFHWHDHHRAARKNDMVDAQYQQTVFSWTPQGKEALALVLTGLAHLPLFPLFPFFTGTVVWRAINYYRVHKRSHLDPTWAREHLPWHYDHHMGIDQNANWCVTHPWFDEVMGTRKVYRYESGKPEEVSPEGSRSPKSAGPARVPPQTTAAAPLGSVRAASAAS